MVQLDLNDQELADGAQAARAAAYRAEQDAAHQSSPTIKETFELSATRYRKLAERFEYARASGSQHSAGRARNT